jgi:hypothetical protein
VSAAATALKEATESSATTSKEAASGDRVAQRLLAKEAAAKADAAGNTPTAGASASTQSRTAVPPPGSIIDEQA